MRVLVCGGREYADKKRVFETLDELHVQFRFNLVINGGALGADKWAREWADEAGVEVRTFEANWREYGYLAGPVRNTQMLVEGRPELVLAFPGGRGTADMVRKAERLGVPVRKVS